MVCHVETNKIYTRDSYLPVRATHSGQVPSKTAAPHRDPVFVHEGRTQSKYQVIEESAGSWALFFGLEILTSYERGDCAPMI